VADERREGMWGFGWRCYLTCLGGDVLNGGVELVWMVLGGGVRCFAVSIE
jgi:hypothetical protein